TGGLERALDVAKAGLKAADRAAQGGLRIDLLVATEVDDRVEQIAYLVFERAFIERLEGLLDLGELLADLVEHTAVIGPVKPHAVRLLAHPIGAQERWQLSRNAVERAFVATGGLTLGALDVLPRRASGGRVGRLGGRA